MVKFQKIYWISQKCFHCYGMVGFKRPYFKSEILTKSQPITIMRRWATLNQTQSTFQSLPVQNNKYFTLNRALTSHMVKTGGWDGIGKCCTFLWRSGDRKGIGGNFHLKRFSANLEEMPFGTPGSNWLPARTNWHESKEGKLALEWWGGEMWGTLTIWFYMLRLFRLFIDIFDYRIFSFALQGRCQRTWPGIWEAVYKRFSVPVGPRSAQDKKALPPCWR